MTCAAAAQQAACAVTALKRACAPVPAEMLPRVHARTHVHTLGQCPQEMRAHTHMDARARAGEHTHA